MQFIKKKKTNNADKDNAKLVLIVEKESRKKI